MAGVLEFDEYGDGIGAAWTVMREHSNRADAEAPVPTCAGWTITDLLAHQGMVHRWVAASLRGTRIDTTAVEAEGRSAPDRGAWLDAGVKDLLQALVDTPDDYDGWFFLADAGPPKFAWARRQCHETSIHAVDAMSVSLGRPPTAEETWLRPRLAADGVDELLTGFVPRPGQHLRCAEPLTVQVVATDTDAAWTMEISTEPVVTTRGRTGAADSVVTGRAVDLYLWSWNRGTAITCEGVPFLDTWRESMRVTWA